jgi:hypothetical protein
MAINDATLGQVIGRKLNIYSVTGKNPDSVPAHAAGNVSEDGVTVF